MKKPLFLGRESIVAPPMSAIEINIESFQERENDHFTYILKKTSNFKVYRRQNLQKVALKSIVPSRICRAYVVFL